LSRPTGAHIGWIVRKDFDIAPGSEAEWSQAGATTPQGQSSVMAASTTATDPRSIAEFNTAFIREMRAVSFWSLNSRTSAQKVAERPGTIAGERGSTRQGLLDLYAIASV